MYNNDKDVVFNFLQRVDYNKSQEEIDFEIGYNFGDYRFGHGDGPGLRKKIRDTIKLLKVQFEGVFDENGNTF